MTLYEDKKELYDSIPAEKFKLVEREEEIHDAKFQTKPIGFLKDVWLRFIKNKASVLAAAVILVIAFSQSSDLA